MSINSEQIRFIITDKDESVFFKYGEYLVHDILSSDMFLSEDAASYHLKNVLNGFQKQVFTKVVKIKIIFSALCQYP